MDALNGEVRALSARDYRAALALAERAADLARGAGYAAGLTNALGLQGACLARLGRHTEALARLDEALGAVRGLDDTALEAGLRHAVGQVHYLQGEYAAALEWALRALPLRRAAGDPVGLASTLNNLGIACHQLGDYDGALSYAEEALRLRRAAGDRTGETHSLTNLGNIYKEMGDPARALECHQRGAALAAEMGQAEAEAFCLVNVGYVCGPLGRWDEGLAAGTRARDLARGLGNRQIEAASLAAVAEALAGLGRLEEAFRAYGEALVAARTGGDRDLACEALIQRGRLLVQSGESGRAHEDLVQAMRLATETGAKSLEAQAHAALCDLCKRDGDAAAALAHFEARYALERAVFTDGADRRARALAVRMDVETAQREAELHRLRSVELAHLNEALQRAGEDKEALLEELRAQAEELARQAAEDGLTGLPNRRMLEGRLAQHFAQARRYGQPLTVALLDVDRFKQVNDRFGHRAGDEVLITVARLLRGHCRACDLAARYGGEEFALVLPETDAAAARTVCERVRRAVASFDWGKLVPGLSVTVSLGVSDDPVAPDHERLLALADAQLYRAKAGGRDRVCG